MSQREGINQERERAARWIQATADISFICHTIERSHRPHLIHQYAVRLIHIEEGGCVKLMGEWRAQGKCCAWSSAEAPLCCSIRAVWFNPSPGRGGGDGRGDVKYARGDGRNVEVKHTLLGGWSSRRGLSTSRVYGTPLRGIAYKGCIDWRLIDCNIVSSLREWSLESTVDCCVYAVSFSITMLSSLNRTACSLNLPVPWLCARLSGTTGFLRMCVCL